MGEYHRAISHPHQTRDQRKRECDKVLKDLFGVMMPSLDLLSYTGKVSRKDQFKSSLAVFDLLLNVKGTLN